MAKQERTHLAVAHDDLDGRAALTLRMLAADTAAALELLAANDEP